MVARTEPPSTLNAAPVQADVNDLVERARAALDPDVLSSEGVEALSALADLVRPA